MHKEPETEADVLGLVLAAITVLPGAFFWRNNTGALRDKNGRLVKFGYPGSGDILGCYYGFFICFEVKFDLGQQRDDQRKFEKYVQSAGGIYAVVRSVEDATELLRMIRENNQASLVREIVAYVMLAWWRWNGRPHK